MCEGSNYNTIVKILSCFHACISYLSNNLNRLIIYLYKISYNLFSFRRNLLCSTFIFVNYLEIV